MKLLLEKKKIRPRCVWCFVFFTLDALVSTMTTATRAQGPFTSTQAGYRAAVIQEISASRESIRRKGTILGREMS